MRRMPTRPLPHNSKPWSITITELRAPTKSSVAHCLRNPAEDPLELTRKAIQHFGRPQNEYNKMQKQALRSLRKLINRKGGGSLLSRLGAEYPSWEVWKSEVEKILDIINRLFLYGSTRVRFKWGKLSPLVGIYRFQGPWKGTIVLDDFHTNSAADEFGFNKRTADRLSTILHEMIHAYLDKACYGPFCSGNNVGGGGHGRAFQRLAHAVEQCIERLFGISLDLQGEYAFWLDWKEGGQSLPSEHDFLEWGWCCKDLDDDLYCRKGSNGQHYYSWCRSIGGILLDIGAYTCWNINLWQQGECGQYLILFLEWFECWWVSLLDIRAGIS